MNILITSVGRRGYIVDYFKAALGREGQVYVGNSSSISSAFVHADESVVTPLIYSKEYIPFLLNYCIEKNIKIIISVFDIDLYILAKNEELFRKNGIRVIVSKAEVIAICNDKWKTYEFFKWNNINTPKCYLSLEDCREAINRDEINYPIIVKPRWGMGSLGIFVANCYNEAECFRDVCIREIQRTYLKYESEFEKDRMIIFQEYIRGEEYGLDIINDLKGKHAVTVIKKKVAMRAGETDAACVVVNAEIEDISKRISSALGHIGNLDVDVLKNEKGIYLLEMNARFGGGYPFSHMAGIDLPRALIKWINNIPIDEELSIKEYNQTWQKDIQLVKVNL